MPIPDFQAVMLPSLITISKKDSISNREVVRQVADHFSLTESERQELLPSGKQRIIDNRVHWAITYMSKAGLISRPSRGHCSITTEGKNVLAESPKEINVKFLKKYDQFKAFHETKPDQKEAKPKILDDSSDPLERLENTYEAMKDTVCGELLERVHDIDPTDFERLVVRLMKAMGYGGGTGEVVHLGRSGDGGVDGQIAQDPLGLDMIYIQAKRYQDGQGVGRPAMQQFVGSLNERKASKGIYVTTSHFSQDARDYVERVDVRIVLIDGQKLARLMFENNIGVSVEQTYAVKSVDSDFFDGDI